MAIFVQPVDIGQLPNDGTGDPLRTAFDKLNNNVISLSQAGAPSGLEGSIQYKDANGSFSGVDGFTFDSSTNLLNIGVNLVPTSNVSINIGSANNKVNTVYTTTLRIGNSSASETANVISFRNTITGNGATVNANVFQSNSVVINNELTVDGVVTGKIVDYTNTATPDQIIFEIPPSQCKTAVFEVQSVYTSGAIKESQTATIKVTNNGIGYPVSCVVYGTVFNRNPLTSYMADTGYGNIRLGVSPLYPVYMTHTITYTIYNG